MKERLWNLAKSVAIAQFVSVVITGVIYIGLTTGPRGTYIPYMEVYADRVWIVASCFTLAFCLWWFSRPMYGTIEDISVPKNYAFKKEASLGAIILFVIGIILSVSWKFRGHAYLS